MLTFIISKCTIGTIYFLCAIITFICYAYGVKTYYQWQSNMECAKFHTDKQTLCIETVNNLNQLLKAPLKISTSTEYKNAIIYWQQEGDWHSEMNLKYIKNVPKWYQEKWIKNNE